MRKKSIFLVALLILSMALCCACGSMTSDSKKSDSDSGSIKKTSNQKSSDKNATDKDEEVSTYLLSIDYYDENGKWFFSKKTDYVKDDKGRYWILGKHNEGDATSYTYESVLISTTEMTYEYDDDFKRELCYQDNHVLWCESILNDEGNTIKQTYYEKNGEVDSVEYYEFDSQGNLIGRIEYLQGSEEDYRFKNIWTYTYTERQKVESVVAENRSGEIIDQMAHYYEYNEEGEPLQVRHTRTMNGHEEGIRTDYYEYEYDDHKHCTYFKNSDGDVTQYKYTYLDDGKYTKQEVTESNSRIEISTYDAKDRIIQKSTFKEDKEVFTIKYVYGIPE